MIKLGRLPGARRVTGFACLREPARNVIRIGRALEILQVTRHTACAGQVEVVVDVAISTLPRRHSVHPRERKAYCRMVKGGGLPAARGVARLASLREVQSHMAGIVRALKVLQMA